MRIAIRDVTSAATWDACVDALRARPGFWLPDSALADGRCGRWSFAGAEPYAIARARGDRIEIEPCRDGGPFAERRAWRAQRGGDVALEALEEDQVCIASRGRVVARGRGGGLELFGDLLPLGVGGLHEGD